MAQKYAGIEFLLKLGNLASPTVFTTVAAQRSTSFSINNEQIDVTDKDDSRWRKLLEGGVRSMSLSGSGLVSNSQTYEDLLQIAVQGTIREYQIVFADGKGFSGDFFLASIESSGEHTDAQQYSITLESAGDVSFDSV